MDEPKHAGLEGILEQLIEHGVDDMANIFARMFELAMRIERERFLGAGHYERTTSRRGYANGSRPQADRHAGRHGYGAGAQECRA